MSSGRAAACMCAENEALIKALRVQIAAQRREMVGMAAELEDAKRELGAVRAETAADREAAAAKCEEARCKIASLQAWAELVVSGTIVPGAYVNDIMSAQPLAVETSLAAGAGTAVVPAAAGAAGAAARGGGGGDGESALVESLRRRLRVHENENTPSRHRSQKNRVRSKYRAIVKIALSAADATDEEAAAAAAEAEGARQRGGQPGHKGASNNQKAEALFQVPLDDCPLCHGGDLEQRRPATKRVWDVLGEWVSLLTPKDGRARAMVELAAQLEGLGAAGPCVCVSVSFARMYCRPCGKIVKASVTFLIDGSAMGEICQAEALMLSECTADARVTLWLGDLRGLPLKCDAVRTARLARSGPLAAVNEQIEDHIAEAPWHARDEAPGKGTGGAPAPALAAKAGAGPPATLEDAAAAAVAATGATMSREFQYILATVPDAIMVRVSQSRSKEAIRTKLARMDGKPYVSDEYVVHARDDPDMRQTDHPHLLRKTEYPAAEAVRVLVGGGWITYTGIILHRRRASKWAEAVVAAVMDRDPTARRYGDPEPAPAAAEAAPAEGPPPPFPQIPLLPMSEEPSASASPDAEAPSTREEAAVRRDEIAADALFSCICHWAKFWDTASARSESHLKSAVVTVLGLYGEDHPARKAITNAMPSLFTAYKHKGMKMDSTDVERGVRDVVHPDRRAHRDVRCPEAAEASSKAPSFTGTCRRNGISPMRAFRKILRDPKWNIFEEARRVRQHRQGQKRATAAAAAAKPQLQMQPRPP